MTGSLFVPTDESCNLGCTYRFWGNSCAGVYGFFSVLIKYEFILTPLTNLVSCV